jgi:hypothetical protein
MPRNPHAVALGRKGGQARAGLPKSELSRIGRLGGRPSRYRIVHAGALERFDGVRWLELHPPYDRAARAFLYRQRA